MTSYPLINLLHGPSQDVMSRKNDASIACQVFIELTNAMACLATVNSTDAQEKACFHHM